MRRKAAPWDRAGMDNTEPLQPGHDREQALERLKKRRDLGTHFVAYLVVNAAVWALWFATGTGYPWPAWLSGIWAIGLVLNAYDVYVRRPITEEDVRREVQRLHPKH
jgi:2TM domain